MQIAAATIAATTASTIVANIAIIKADTVVTTTAFPLKITIVSNGVSYFSIARPLNIFKNLDNSAASFCHHVAAWVPDMLCSIYLATNDITVTSSETIEVREK
jgi:hypothetical protein